MAELEAIKQFLVTSSQKGYGAGDTVVTKEKDDSNTIEYSKEDFRLHDNYFGGEPFGGREVVFYKDKPVWMMVYYGAVMDEKDLENVYNFLRKCLLNPDSDLPIRGPKLFLDDDWEYTFRYTGGIKSFKGSESIKYKNQTVFEGEFAGGLVDRKI